MEVINNISCVILAGGKGSRLDGKGKYKELLHNDPLWKHVYDRVKSQSNKIVINLNKKIEKIYNTPEGVDYIYDIFKEDIGPLAGIHSALTYASKTLDNKMVCTVPVDTPFLPKDLIKKLYKEMVIKNSDVVVAMSNQRPHPTIAMWKIKIKKELELHIKKGTRKIDKFTGDLNVSYVNWKSTQSDPFFNINNYDDLKLAKNMLHKKY